MVINQILYGGIFIQFMFLIFYFFMFKKQEFLYLMLSGFSVVIFLTLILYPDLSFVFRVSGLPFTADARNAFLFCSFSGYYMFCYHFLGEPEKHVFFGKIVKWVSTGLLIAGALYLVRNLLGTNGDWLLNILVPIYFINFLMQAYSVYYLFSTGKARNRIISYATLFLFVIAKFTIIPSFKVTDLGAHLLENSHFVLIGVNINFFFFSLVTIYGMWQEIKSMAKLELENARELYQQRVDISNDLHDDLGATLSSLHIYSSIAQKYVEENPVKARVNLDLISSNVFTLMEKINDVIWSVSSKQSNVSLLSTRIKDCFVNIFDAAGIKCTYDIDESIEMSITGLKARKFLLLFAKEAINNAIKHSGAKAIRFAIQKSNDKLLMSIEDNGVGIGDLDFTKGNGLSNLKHRADQLKGHFSIETLQPRGTLVECMIPLTNISL
jgi:signal transduction histidine kinase